jgi:hypothetical protein
MHHLQTRSVATTAQHLTDAHHSDRLPQAAVARPSGGGGVGGHVAGCDRQTVVHDFDFYFLKPPEGVVPKVYYRSPYLRTAYCTAIRSAYTQ